MKKLFMLLVFVMVALVMVGTVGATPIRMLVLIGVLILLVTQFEMNAGALVGSMLATMVFGFFVEGWTFNTLTKLAKAAKAQGRAEL